MNSGSTAQVIERDLKAGAAMFNVVDNMLLPPDELSSVSPVAWLKHYSAGLLQLHLFTLPVPFAGDVGQKGFVCRGGIASCSFPAGQHWPKSCGPCRPTCLYAFLAVDMRQDVKTLPAPAGASNIHAPVTPCPAHLLPPAFAPPRSST